MDRPLDLTYDELLEEIKEMLNVFSRACSTPLDSFDRGCRSGAINFWYKLAMKTPATEKQCRDDQRLLCLLAGLEPPDDVR